MAFCNGYINKEEVVTLFKGVKLAVSRLERGECLPFIHDSFCLNMTTFGAKLDKLQDVIHPGIDYNSNIVKSINSVNLRSFTTISQEN